jgi:hypothetical protein
MRASGGYYQGAHREPDGTPPIKDYLYVTLDTCHVTHIFKGGQRANPTVADARADRTGALGSS